jgi:hypothetical protein
MAALLVQSQGVVPTGEIPSPPQLPPTNDSARLSQRNKLPLPQQGELELNGLCSRSGESRQYHGVDHVNDPVPSAEICQNNPGFAPNIVSADSDESGHLFQSISDSIPGLVGQLSERSDARALS